MRRIFMAVAAVLAIAVASLVRPAVAAPAAAATLVEVTGFGANPTNLRMYLYVPDRLAARPAVVVASHYCGGSGPAFHAGRPYASLADRYGYIVIYPSVTRSSKCWDVASPQALRRGGGSDPVGIMSMVDYVKQRFPVDPARIFAVGESSGAMMTNVLLGLYPDVIAAGASIAGVPFACFATANGSEWNADCAQGRITKTPQQWGDLVRGAYPGYTGPRPRMQIWHGTDDDVLRYPNFGEQVKQWTNVHGLGQTPVLTDSPKAGYTRTRYGSSSGAAPVEAISLQGRGHGLPDETAEIIRFFGLDTTPPTTPPSPMAQQIVGTQSGRCLTVPGSSTTNGTQTQLSDCTGAAGQTWTYTAGKQLTLSGGKCLDASGRGTTNGTPVVIWDCNGQNNQQWNVNPNGTITGVHSGLCLDANAAGTANGTRITLWTCHGGTNQQWSRR
ncbi:PHB depolymerase family esterase [Streptomyces sp. NPDC012466]|jgi:poly(hydroxyalkanoate) depolymerase family esterase|uniref:extracellular catalytic domain type 1 short-chain-length polyhydroxyalkanoate depolymerase n=1 Tax=Streptomyces sp. NPDC012466 TaxID=3364835 RepID=UPI0036EED485